MLKHTSKSKSSDSELSLNFSDKKFGYTTGLTFKTEPTTRTNPMLSNLQQQNNFTSNYTSFHSSSHHQHSSTTHQASSNFQSSTTNTSTSHHNNSSSIHTTHLTSPTLTNRTHSIPNSNPAATSNLNHVNSNRSYGGYSHTSYSIPISPHAARNQKITINTTTTVEQHGPEDELRPAGASETLAPRPMMQQNSDPEYLPPPPNYFEETNPTNVTQPNHSKLHSQLNSIHEESQNNLSQHSTGNTLTNINSTSSPHSYSPTRPNYGKSHFKLNTEKLNLFGPDSTPNEVNQNLAGSSHFKLNVEKLNLFGSDSRPNLNFEDPEARDKFPEPAEYNYGSEVFSLPQKSVPKVNPLFESAKPQPNARTTSITTTTTTQQSKNLIDKEPSPEDQLLDKMFNKVNNKNEPDFKDSNQEESSEDLSSFTSPTPNDKSSFAGLTSPDMTASRHGPHSYISGPRSGLMSPASNHSSKISQNAAFIPKKPVTIVDTTKPSIHGFQGVKNLAGSKTAPIKRANPPNLPPKPAGSSNFLNREYQNLPTFTKQDAKPKILEKASNYEQPNWNQPAKAFSSQDNVARLVDQEDINRDLEDKNYGVNTIKNSYENVAKMESEKAKAEYKREHQMEKVLTWKERQKLKEEEEKRKLEEERAETERLKAELEKAEKLAQEKILQEREEKERIQKQQELERIQQEEQRQKQLRIEEEKRQQQHQEEQKRIQERIEQERQEQARLLQERQENERLKQQLLEKQREETAKFEKSKLDFQRKESEMLERLKQEEIKLKNEELEKIKLKKELERQNELDRLARQLEEEKKINKLKYEHEERMRIKLMEETRNIEARLKFEKEKEQELYQEKIELELKSKLNENLAIEKSQLEANFKEKLESELSYLEKQKLEIERIKNQQLQELENYKTQQQLQKQQIESEKQKYLAEQSKINLEKQKLSAEQERFNQEKLKIQEKLAIESAEKVLLEEETKREKERLKYEKQIIEEAKNVLLEQEKNLKEKMTLEFAKQQEEILAKQKEIENLKSQAKLEAEKAEKLKIEIENESKLRKNADAEFKLKLEEENRKKFLEKQKIYETKTKLLEQQISEVQKQAEKAETALKIEQENIKKERQKLKDRERNFSQRNFPVPKQRTSVDRQPGQSGHARDNSSDYDYLADVTYVDPKYIQRSPKSYRGDSMLELPHNKRSSIKKNYTEKKKHNSGNQAGRPGFVRNTMHESDYSGTEAYYPVEADNPERKSSTETTDFTLSRPAPHEKGRFASGYAPEGKYLEREEANKSVAKRTYGAVAYAAKPKRHISATSNEDSIDFNTQPKGNIPSSNYFEPDMPRRPHPSSNFPKKVLPIETRPIFPTNKPKNVKYYPNQYNENTRTNNKTPTFDFGVQKNDNVNVTTQTPPKPEKVKPKQRVFTENDLIKTNNSPPSKPISVNHARNYGIKIDFEGQTRHPQNQISETFKYQPTNESTMERGPRIIHVTNRPELLPRVKHASGGHFTTNPEPVRPETQPEPPNSRPVTSDTARSKSPYDPTIPDTEELLRMLKRQRMESKNQELKLEQVRKHITDLAINQIAQNSTLKQEIQREVSQNLTSQKDSIPEIKPRTASLNPPELPKRPSNTNLRPEPAPSLPVHNSSFTPPHLSNQHISPPPPFIPQNVPTYQQVPVQPMPVLQKPIYAVQNPSGNFQPIIEVLDDNEKYSASRRKIEKYKKPVRSSSYHGRSSRKHKKQKHKKSDYDSTSCCSSWSTDSSQDSSSDFSTSSSTSSRRSHHRKKGHKKSKKSKRRGRRHSSGNHKSKRRHHSSSSRNRRHRSSSPDYNYHKKELISKFKNSNRSRRHSSDFYSSPDRRRKRSGYESDRYRPERRVTYDDDDEVESRRDWHQDFNRTVVHADYGPQNPNQTMMSYAPQNTTMYQPQTVPIQTQMIPIQTPNPGPAMVRATHRMQPNSNTKYIRNKKTGQLVAVNETTPIVLRPKAKKDTYRRKSGGQGSRFEVVSNAKSRNVYPPPRSYQRNQYYYNN